MKPKAKYTPFEGNLNIAVTDADCEPVDVSTLADVQVLLMVNGLVKLKFNKAGGSGWIAWIAGNDNIGVLCPVTEAQSSGWRGLMEAQVQQIDMESNELTKRLILFQAVKSSYTPVPSPAANPITFTTAFSCDGYNKLNFTCNISAPDGNYIIQYLDKDMWRRLFDGYVTLNSGGEGGSYATSITPSRQLAAGNYQIRIQNAVSGAKSEEVQTFIADCREGRQRFEQTDDWRWSSGFWWWGGGEI